MRSSMPEAVSTQPIQTSAIGRLAYRVARMMLAWLVLGALLGGVNGWYIGGGGLGIVAQMIAGMIILPLLGGLLGLVFDRAKESLIGGVFGAVVGLLGVAISPVSSPSEAVGVCVVIGGLIGATCWPWLGILMKTVALTLWLRKTGVEVFQRRRTAAFSPGRVTTLGAGLPTSPKRLTEGLPLGRGSASATAVQTYGRAPRGVERPSPSVAPQRRAGRP